MVAAWEILCAAAAMGMILLKCRLPHSRTFLCLPLIPFALSLAYCYAYVTRIRWVWVLAGDMTVAQCLHIPQELRIRSRGTERHSASD